MASQQQPLALPQGFNPDTLDTLTELATILTRLRTPAAGGPGSQSASSATPSQSLPHSSSSQLQSHSQSQQAAGAGGLALKDLPGQSDQLKHRFQKARALIKTLPDMDRSISEQEAEIAMLENKIARQRETLEKLKEVGAKFSVRDDGDGERMEE